MIEKAYFDESGKPTVCNAGFHKTSLEYNPQGNLVKLFVLRER